MLHPPLCLLPCPLPTADCPLLLKGANMDPNAIDRAEHRRDRRLRRRVLQVLGAARVRPEYGWVTGRFVYDLVDGALPGGEAFDADGHMLALVRDLVSAGYVEERDDRRYEWQQPGL